MRKFLLIFIFFYSVIGHAQTLLVSDIDDTIKLAHVKDLSEAARYAFDDKSRFMGMSELYHLLAQDQANFKVVYLSKAPRWLMGRAHQSFLNNGKFPVGEYIPRTDYGADEHKLKSIRNLMNSMKPRKVILIGDNGERDAEVYSQIAKEYANQGIEFHQFIRIVYANSELGSGRVRVYDGQIGFVTPVEISLELEKEHLLEPASAQWLVKNVGEAVASEKLFAADGEVAFPRFVNCADFVWKWDDSLVRFESLQALKTRLVERCKLRL